MLLENGFNISYEIKKIRSVKVVPSGDFNGNKYGASVQFVTYNVEQIEDDELGFTDRETNLVIKVPCSDDIVKKFNLFLRDRVKAGEFITIFGDIPRNSGKNTYQVTSSETAQEIMKRYEQQPPKKK